MSLTEKLFTQVKRKPLLLLIPVLILVGIAYLSFRIKNRDSAKLSDPIKKQTIIESVYGIGTITAHNSYQMKVGITSGITELFVREGDTVKKGQKLLSLDVGTSLRAPFDGTITYLPVKAGETVFPQSIVMSLVDLKDRYIVVSLEQRGAIRVKQEQSARISFDNMRDMTFDGVVQSIYSNESNFLVRINISKLPPQLLPGMTGDVAITIDEHKDAIVIPIAAIEEGKVKVRRDGRSQTVEVQTGITDGALAEVTNGTINEGDQVYLRAKSTP